MRFTPLLSAHHYPGFAAATQKILQGTEQLRIGVLVNLVVVSFMARHEAGARSRTGVARLTPTSTGST